MMIESKRYISLDYGDRRIGIAFSDLTGTIASAYEVYERSTIEKDIEYLTKFIQKK